MKSAISIYGFLDYREFVRALYHSERKVNPAYSFGLIARRGEIASRAYVKLVMDGKRNLSQKTIPKFARGLGLARTEAKYFELLVRFSQEEDGSTKLQLYRELGRFSQRRKATSLAEAQQQSYYSKWHTPVIRELVLVRGFPRGETLAEQSSWISRMLPSVSVSEASQAITSLLSCGLLEQDPEQGLRQSSRFIEGSDGVPDFTLREFHRQMICQALSRVNDPIEERYLSGVTLAVRASDLPRAVEAIQEFRRQFDREFSAPDGADAVHELNIQFLRLSRPESAPKERLVSRGRAAGSAEVPVSSPNPVSPNQGVVAHELP